MDRLKIICLIKRIKNFFDKRKTNKLEIDKPKKKIGCFKLGCISVISFLAICYIILFKFNVASILLLDYLANCDDIVIKTGPNMHYARYNHSQATLDDGNVLVIGGVGEKVQHQPELYIAKKNKFVKLKKTECAYHSPEIFKDTKGRVIISEDTCKNNVAFNSETRTFENITEIVKKDTELDKNSKFSNKETTYVNINFVKKNNKNYEILKRTLESDYNLKPEETRTVTLAVNGSNPPHYITLCDKGSGFALQDNCKVINNWSFSKTRNNSLSLNITIPKFKYSILNSAMSKIGEDKYLITGGSTSEQIGVDIPHKHTQILSRSER